MSALYGVYSVISSKAFVTLPIPSAPTDLSQHIIVVTGANAGLGFESCMHLSRLGVGKLIMGVRTISKGEDAKARILEQTRRSVDSIEVWNIDMDSYDSVKAFAARLSELPRLDGVLANAGIMTSQWATSAGYEKTLTVNVISTFLLYLLLVPRMNASGRETGYACRFTIPNTALHFFAPTAELDPSAPSIIDRLNDQSKADMKNRYPVSKLLVLYAVRELSARNAASAGKGHCVLNTPNPSFCKSGLANEMSGSKGFQMIERVMARTTEEGSRVLVDGLLQGEESDGQYLANCHIAAVAKAVTNKWGQTVQKKFTDELLERLDRIVPRVSSNV